MTPGRLVVLMLLFVFLTAAAILAVLDAFGG